MRGSLGQILVQQGVIDASALSDALAHQSGRHPLGSELYMLGYASERQLVLALSAQTGWPGIVFDESVIRLDVLEYVSLEWARIFSALVVYEDPQTLVIAAARPEDASVPARELAASRGKRVELRIALDVTLARTIRVAFARWKTGELFLAGPEADRSGPYIAVVHPDRDDDEHRRAQRALAEEAARNIERNEELPSEESGGAASTGDWQIAATTTTTGVEELEQEERTMEIAAELDRGEEPDTHAGRQRALVVDPDPPNRIQMVSQLEQLDYECQAAATGMQALQLLSSLYFDIVFADIATPELDGLRLCRAIKRSKRLGRCKVIVTTAVVDSGQIADDDLARHGADGYLEKPLDSRRLRRLLRDLSNEERGDHEALLADALGRYHSGDIEGAIARLRGALTGDPSSPKLHFMLANMLQRASRWAEAVDEYEAVVELQPAYFPALTRLAYLYFRQGLHARAVETWRRALPVCEDPALRRNIELFMRKLVADMAKSDSA
ncbi:MAG: response regulator [Deltaproteobacteria bacterium]|nr:MAG: response regulator [Deltaproteobacteria bacterium]TMQ16415.1 MAG: response regulator [Deltaproteobacteria bacterium]